MYNYHSHRASVTQVSPLAYTKLIPPPLLLDVRSVGEYRAEHIPNAINLSLLRLLIGQLPIINRWVLPDWFQALSKDQPIVVVCLTSHRSPLAAAQLLKAGFTQVFNLSGGMQHWRQCGFNTISGYPSGFTVTTPGHLGPKPNT
ncbi:rhodanese-like domain-containing protein [Acaryochloris marina]|uniref:rhodanese-like domain-containing protein n=1 Tax=Acaryochloris marina TaxID=155978 RepID=UPI00059F26E9|nr:rhodanese-like domain-containing protein [Acaryochloris marina]BDM80389.1 hypothetical protein AM10699_32570 [Acaryochloris marina MBIC10699]